jgi:hypothetical protein
MRGFFAGCLLIDQSHAPAFGLQCQSTRNPNHASAKHCHLSTGFKKIHVPILLEI